MEKTITARPDLTGRADIILLVDRFYERVRADATLGHVFDDVAQVNWETHLPKLYSFWDSVLFGANTFRGNLLGAHAQLIPAAGMEYELFEHWLTLFRATVVESFDGPKAGHILRCAEDMANVIYSKIHGVPDPRFDGTRLSPEQPARDVPCRDQPAAGL